MCCRNTVFVGVKIYALRTYPQSIALTGASSLVVFIVYIVTTAIFYIARERYPASYEPKEKHNLSRNAFALLLTSIRYIGEPTTIQSAVLTASSTGIRSSFREHLPYCLLPLSLQAKQLWQPLNLRSFKKIVLISGLVAVDMAPSRKASHSLAVLPFFRGLLFMINIFIRRCLFSYTFGPVLRPNLG